jgi:ankyrin repeat protein
MNVCLGWTPLHAASYMGRLQVVELLLKKEADVKAKDNKGKKYSYKSPL